MTRGRIIVVGLIILTKTEVRGEKRKKEERKKESEEEWNSNSLLSLVADSEERVLFAISFRHVDAEKSTANEDIHGEGSILEELAGRKLQLGSLR